ncbi:MAG: restriction endonuclease [Chloroflexi bacterium]|nr:restriction endonuclease [Chloroflexota bacterium]MCI0649388.1 restriction endonuclease [Chloroflexota bacterium]
MNFLDAAYQVLQQAQEPLHFTEIARRALAQQLIITEGRTPDATMGSRLYVDTKKEDSRFQRVGKGYFALAQRVQTDEISQRVNIINQRTHHQLGKFLHDMPADRFEALIGELLIAIGFEEDTVQVTRYHRDGGVDVRGVLNAGSITRINAAVQVKKWQKNVQAPDVQNLRGSLTTHEQGIIITTGDFSPGARSEANAIGKTPISLVNGNELLELLIEHDIGVNKEQHTVLSLDEEWWGELIAPTAVASVPEPIPNQPDPVSVTYPLIVRAMNSDTITAQLLNSQGHIVYSGKQYTSPSTAGKDASGWKSCNGWNYWRYQHPETKEWRAINDLRSK